MRATNVDFHDCYCHRKIGDFVFAPWSARPFHNIGCNNKNEEGKILANQGISPSQVGSSSVQFPMSLQTLTCGPRRRKPLSHLYVTFFPSQNSFPTL